MQRCGHVAADAHGDGAEEEKVEPKVGVVLSRTADERTWDGVLSMRDGLATRREQCQREVSHGPRAGGAEDPWFECRFEGGCARPRCGGGEVARRELEGTQGEKSGLRAEEGDRGHVLYVVWCGLVL